MTPWARCWPRFGLDLEKDTVVVYTSDHGEMLGDHGLWHKFQFYEGSCGVPLVVRAPGVTSQTGGRRPSLPGRAERSRLLREAYS